MNEAFNRLTRLEEEIGHLETGTEILHGLLFSFEQDYAEDPEATIEQVHYMRDRFREHVAKLKQACAAVHEVVRPPKIAA